MKSIYVFLVLSFSALSKPISAQEHHWHKVHKLDTIYANDQMNVALFFPEPIRQGITGTENFIFTFNREKGQHLGLLQAKPGKDSNLLVIGENGSAFSYILKYKTELSNLNYFIEQSGSIGDERQISADNSKAGTEVILSPNRVGYYNRFCGYLLKKKSQNIVRSKKRNEGIVLSLKNIVFDDEELYFVIEIDNRSSLDYDLNFLRFSTEIRPKGRKKSFQRINREPVFKYKVPSKIREGEKACFVYVFSKFSMSSDRIGILELNEQNGERHIQLKISHKSINNPN